jgi:galactokinase
VPRFDSGILLSAMTIDTLRARLEAGSPVPREWSSVRELIPPLLDVFTDRFPGPRGREISVGFVPGRIEVLGRHTDYAGGRSLVCAIDRGFLYAASANRRGLIRMSEDSREFPAAEFPLEPSIAPRAGHWSNYPMTMARRLVRNFGPSVRLAGVDVAFTSTLPVGGGMSGSSALMMMTFLAIAEANGLHRKPVFRREIRDGLELATYLACCENGRSFRGLAGSRGVGTFGGSEDHAAILNGRAERLSLFQYAPTVFMAEIGWPASHVFALAFSGVRAEKTREARDRYNLAARRAREATAVCNRAWGTKLANLREVVDHATVEYGRGELRAIARALAGGDPRLDLPGRVRHFMIEDRTHIPAAVGALGRGDVTGFARIVTASHEASRRYLRNIVPPVHDLAKEAIRRGAEGAGGFGAGFGGSLLAVVPTAGAAEFLGRWRASYEASHPTEGAAAEFFLARPSDGIRIWDGEWSGRYVDRVFPQT